MKQDGGVWALALKLYRLLQEIVCGHSLAFDYVSEVLMDTAVHCV